MKPTLHMILYLLSIALMTGCSNNARPATSSGNAPPVMGIANDDIKMNAAIDNARATVSTFTDALQHPKNGQMSFTFKVRLTDPNQPGVGEHIWLSDPSFDGTKLHGTVGDGDQPQQILTAKVGDRLSEDPKKISDWMFVDNGKLRGGYTQRVMYEEASPEEKAQIRQQTGFTDADMRASD
jgi:uncharacterized protein YegJ (DUF2314 family)